MAAPPPASPPLRLLGAPASPYSRKMRALMRHRRLPFVWIHRGSEHDRGTPAARPRCRWR